MINIAIVNNISMVKLNMLTFIINYLLVNLKYIYI